MGAGLLLALLELEKVESRALNLDVSYK